jgi:capsid protein
MAATDSGVNLIGRIAKGVTSFFSAKSESVNEPHKHKMSASYYGAEASNMQVFGISYNGEKNLGSMGPVKVYALDYQLLRLRSWQSYLDSDVSQLIINKYVMSVIGGGLKLQANPHMKVLEAEGIKFDAEKFNDTMEAYWESFCKSKTSDYYGKDTLRKQMAVTQKNRKVGGDVLVILRYSNGQPTIQLIDGDHVWNPIMGNDNFAFKIADGQPGAGNFIRNGIEYSPDGQTVAFYVRTANPGAGMSYYTGTFERVLSKSVSTGLTMAYMVTGLEYRIDNKRGMPFLSAVLDTISIMDRYKIATNTTAEERSKISYQVVQQAFSTDENPFKDSLAKIRNSDATVNNDVPTDINGIQLNSKAVSSANKTALFLPKGQKIETLNQNGDAQLYFKDFYGTNFDLVCSVVLMPPEVAKSQYDSNYSASRAAIKDWQHTILVERQDFGVQFLQPIYELFFHIMVLQNKIQAPGYLKAFAKKDNIVLNAYRHCHWIGSGVANIDPLKEVMAARLKLGVTGAGIPFSTVEKILEDLGEMSDVPAIIEQYAKELKLTKKAKIKIPEDQKTGAQPNDKEKGNDDEKSKAIMKMLANISHDKLMELAKQILDDEDLEELESVQKI